MLLTVSIDHARVKYLDQYRVTSPVFNVFLPQSNVVGIPAGTIGPVVSDGYWLLLTPLSPRGAYHPFPRQNHCKVLKLRRPISST